MTSILAADHPPLYQRIANSLAAKIASGALKVGERLPSERQMAEDLGASRMTARQALKLLERRGLVETRTGRGAFVAHPRIEQQLSTLSGFTEEMNSRRPQRFQHRARRGRRRGGSGSGGGARRRRACAGTSPCSRASGGRRTRRSRAHRNPGRTRAETVGTSRLQHGFSLYRVLREEYGLYPSEAEQKLWSAHPDAVSAVSLGISPQSPVLVLTRRTLDATRRPLEYVRAVYRGDCFVMRVNLTLGKGA